MAKDWGLVRYPKEEAGWRLAVRAFLILFFLGSGIYYVYLGAGAGLATLVYGLASLLVAWMWTPHFSWMTLRYFGGELETGIKLLVSVVTVLVHFG